MYTDFYYVNIFFFNFCNSALTSSNLTIISVVRFKTLTENRLV